MKTELKNIDKSRIVVEVFNTSLQEQIHKKLARIKNWLSLAISGIQLAPIEHSTHPEQNTNIVFKCTWHSYQKELELSFTTGGNVT